METSLYFHFCSKSESKGLPSIDYVLVFIRARYDIDSTKRCLKLMPLYCSVLGCLESMVLERHLHFVCSLETPVCPAEMRM